MSDIAGDSPAPAGIPAATEPSPRMDRPRSALSVALAISVAAPFLLLGVSAWRAWEVTWQAAQDEAARASDAGAEYARRVLDALLLRADAANELLRGIPDATLREQEQDFHGRLRAIPLREAELGAPLLRVQDREGRSLVSDTDYPASPPERAMRHRDFSQALRVPGAPAVHVSGVYLGEGARHGVFAVSRRREGSGNGLPDGSFDGAVSVAIEVTAIGERLRRLARDSGDAIALLRADGQVLVRAAWDEIGTPAALPADHPLVGRMQRGEELTVGSGASAVDGNQRVGAIRRVGNWPVYVSVARSQAAVVAAWRRQVLPLAVLATGCGALLALLALAIRRRDGALQAINTQLEQRVAARTAELAGSAAEFRATFEESPMGLAQADPATGRFLRVNAAYCALTGYGAAELLGGMGPADLTHPDDRAADAARFRHTASTGARYRAEKRYLRKDGVVAWVEVSAGLIRNPRTGAPMRTIATIQDITERKRAEERLLLLTREVDHRAKNALAVVQAAVRLAPRHDAAAFARAVEGRIAALAGAQVVLSEAHWRGADLRMLAESAVKAFRAEDPGASRVPVVMLGPPLLLAATAAQPISLALHELATNAAKYGALSVADGRVVLAWSMGADGLLRLRWEETGGPPVPAVPARRGFGSRVLDATMQDQLGGTVERRWKASGLVCDITLPRSVLGTRAA